MDTSLLQQLFDHPGSDEYLPARIIAFGESYPCEVKFRGSTSLSYPKKNWRIKFPNEKNIFQSDRLNLNAEYRDQSLMRNHLMMQISHYYQQPAPSTRFIRLYINDKFMGVYLQVEEIDRSFLNTKGVTADALYKAISHGASMAPLTHASAYPKNWEIRIGDESNYADLQRTISRIYYLPADSFETAIEDIIDADNIIQYFAIVFATISPDCMTKNYFLYRDLESRKYGLIPWDQDASLGNDIHGSYQIKYERYIRKHPLDNQTLFNRLMEVPHFRNLFHEKVDNIIHAGFDVIGETIDSSYTSIREWVYLDSLKKPSNSSFDREINRLKSFLEKRRTFLENFKGFDRRPISGFHCSNPYPSEDNPNILFQVYSPEPQDIYLMYTQNLKWDVYGQTFTLDSLKLYDDGGHGDLLANDGIFGNSLNWNLDAPKLIPYCFRASRFDYPANGLFYASCERTHTMALNGTGDALPPSPESIRFDEIYRTGNQNHVRLSNITEQRIDLSYCVFQSGEDWQRLLIPENIILEPHSSLILSSDFETARALFPDERIVDGLFFDVGDTLILLSPAWTPILEQPVQSKQPLSLVINEMNIRSSDLNDSDDWIELYNPNEEDVSLKGWSIKDNQGDHCFVFLKDETLHAGNFFVCCRDTSRFFNVYQKLFQTVGNMDFGLDGVEDAIRLYDDQGMLIDSVGYDNRGDWFPEPEDRTLELIDPARDNSRAENWALSVELGTPGRQNSVWSSVDEYPAQNSDDKLFRVFPNPFNSTLTIHLDQSCQEQVRISIHNMLGQKVASLVLNPGQETAAWNAAPMSTGVYFITMKMENRTVSTQKILLVR